jgi:exonuclease SbcC
MKINRIYLKNINSFKGEHTIDFASNPLSNSGLFAIVGPTGAGKSTLLDAITLALFNRIPRFDKKVSKDLVGAGGSILTRGERECCVEIEYTSKSGTYISKWWINVNKNNNLNDYGMEIVDKNTGMPITNKKTEVPDKNQQFIGLSYDQFVKSILLSQGEFSKFLKSGKDERGKLLEDITGMQIYRQLGQKAFQIFKEKGIALTEKRQHKTRIEVKLVSDEIEQKWGEDLLLKQKNRQDNEEKLELYKSKIFLKNELKTLQESITQKETEKLKAQAEWQKFEEEKIPLLSSHEAAEPFKEKIIELENEEKVLSNIQVRLQTEKIDLTKNEQQLWQTLQAIEALTKTNINTENAFKVLQEFRNTVAELINQQGNQKNILAQRKSQICEIIEPLSNEKLKAIQINQLSEQSLKVITEIAEALKTQRNEWLALIEIQDENQFSHQREKFETARKSLGQLKNLIKEFSEAQKEVNDATKEEEKQQNLITTNSPILEKTQKQLAETEILIEKLELEKNKLSKSYNFDKERYNLLQKDEPCPLCGSVEHPFLSHYANNYVEIDQEIITKKNTTKRV